MFNQLFSLSNYYLNPFAMPVFLVSITIFFIGSVVLFQNRRSLINISFFLKCFSAGFWLFTASIVYCCLNEAVAHTLYKYFTFLGVVSIGPSLYFFSVCWSNVAKRQKYMIPLVYIAFYVLYGVTVTTDVFILPGMRKYFWGLYPIYGQAMGVFVIMFTTTYLLSFMNTFNAYHRETIPIKKRQKGIIAFVLALGYLGSIDFISKFFDYTVFPVGYLAIFVYISLVAYSIVRYRAFDIETVIHKTALWVLSFSFVVIPVFFLYDWLLSHIELKIIKFALWTATFLIFALYLRVVQPKIDHIFQRRRADLEIISRMFIEELVHLKGLNNLLRLIKDTIADVLYSQQVDIFIYNQERKIFDLFNQISEAKQRAFLKDDDRFLEWLTKNNRIAYKEFIYLDPQYAKIRQAAKKYFALNDAVLVIPLIADGKLLGVINLGKKANLKRYTAMEFNFLNTLKNESAIAISNSLLYENMEDQVRQRSKELLEMQKQLVQAEKLATVGTLAGGVAHEINNPLAAILTNVQMLLHSAEIADPSDKESLELIEEATQRCRVIVKKLMVYARKPLHSSEISRINLSAVVNNVISFLEYQLTQENIAVVIDIQDLGCVIKGNQNELEQVVTNMILNAKDAIKKVKRGGTIEMSLVTKGRWVCLEIKDEGEGIPQEIKSKIFDPFFTTKDVGKGLGLGLSICQSIIERHDGVITVDSEPNKGAVFTINLIRAEATDKITKNKS
ncbi:MAG: GHKL domain-containing protein [PVC group bacterium]|nr:GHKL domain-containing protein [PVC group bacterium]